MKNLEGQNISGKKLENPVENHEKEKGLRILIVDDQPYNFYQLKSNENITLAKSVDEAEQYLKSGEFDVMFLDGHLDMDDVFDNGPDALAHWIEEGVNVPPTFMISSDEEMQKKGTAAGAKGAIAKSLIFSGDMTAIEKATKITRQE
jgi:CheY-like chemotaxis protein